MKRILIAGLCLAMLAGCAPAASDSGPASAPPAAQEPIIEAQPQTEAWPLTGLALDEGTKQAPRPFAVMIDNTRRAYPQWGIGKADAMVEAVTEGGVTRLMCLYSRVDDMETRVGPVRSARDVFLQLAMPLNAVPVHIGSSSFANNFLNYYSWTTIDGLVLGTSCFDLDRSRMLTRDADGNRTGSEHSWYTHAAALSQAMETRGIQPDGGMIPLLDFAADAAVSGDQTAASVQMSYSYETPAGFTYDAGQGKYLKTSFDGAPHVDANDNTQLAFDNLLLLQVDTRLKPDGVHTDFELTQGEGWWICGGKLQPVRWEKGDPEQPLCLFSEDGKALSVKAGKTYIGLLSGTDGESLTVDGVALLGGASADASSASAATA